MKTGKKLKKRIHIFGASGSGTTTLGKALSEKTGIPFFDSDDFYWKETDPPFMEKRPIEERQIKLKQALSGLESWILSGSMMEWGDFLIPELDIAVYLYIDQKIRLDRLIKREKERYGKRIESGNDLYQEFINFLEWAKNYDTGGMEMRSRTSHYEWMKKLSCKITKIEKEFEIEKGLEIVLGEIE